MGRKAKSIKLNSTQRAALENGYKTGKRTFSKRCHIILLKSTDRTSKEVAEIVGTNPISVNSWVKRYEQSGIKGLHTKSGQGRKPILDKKQDKEKVKKAVKAERQRLKRAKDELEKSLNKTFSLKTLKRFLKNLSANGSAFV